MPQPSLSPSPLRVLPSAVVVLLLAACGTGTVSPSGSAPASLGPAPSESAGEVVGIALADADLDLLLGAFSDYGFTMQTEPDETGNGGNLWTGTAHDGEVEVVVIESGGTIEQVGMFDYSAGDVGLDELGFVIGIFAPEAEAWLVDQATQAIENPGTEMRVRQEFDLVALEFNAFIDETQSLDLWVQPPEDGS